jgi:hypothetical protein
MKTGDCSSFNPTYKRQCDHPPKDARRPGGLRFVFNCGVLGDDQRARISLQAEEIGEYRFVHVDEGAQLLSGPVRRRVLACVRAEECVYLEDGRPIGAVSG